MKKIYFLVVCLVLTAVFAASSNAQATTAQPAASSTKIGVIDTFAFGDEKAGITKVVNAVKALNTEFKPLNDEILTMQTKLEGLATEIDNINKLLKTNPKAVDPKSAQGKVDEAEKLQRDIKFKQEEGKSRFEKRQQAVMGPIMQDVYKAIQEYTEKKGYLLILDGAKLEESGSLVGFDTKANVTQDFITFYNARPATTATTATPK